MKRFFLLAIVVAGTVSPALARIGIDHSGGGDTCENRIKEIRDDIGSWITNGGPKGLNLKNMSVAEYSKRMQHQIQKSKVKCVGLGDKDFPISVSGTPKICKFDGNANSTVVTCDFVKLSSLAATDQYVLIHHEYAGLAGIEVPFDSDSDYSISNQLAQFLSDQIVSKLTIKSISLKTSSPTHIKCQSSMLPNAAQSVDLDLRLVPLSSDSSGLFSTSLSISSKVIQGYVDPLGLSALGLGDGDYIVQINGEFWCNSKGGASIPNLDCQQSHPSLIVSNRTKKSSKTYITQYAGFKSALHQTSDTDGIQTREMITIGLYFVDEMGKDSKIVTVLPYETSECKIVTN